LIIGLSPGGELDLFSKNPGRFLEDGGIMEVDGKGVLEVG
jgi:hypothetical protein